MSMLSLFVDFLFPRSEEEERLLALFPAELLEALPHSPFISNEASALFEYANKEVKDLVWQVKYKGDGALAGKLGVLLFDTLSAWLEEEQMVEKYGVPLIIPAPISPARRLERGWNQAELLINEDMKGFEYAPKALVKARHTESQTKARNKAERLENLKGSMKATEEVSGHLCVFIDDVYTTGATFAEAKRALAEAGARKVICLAVAH